MFQVRELLRVNDANGVRLLAIITDQFVADPKLVIWKAQETPMTEKCRYLWDQLGNFEYGIDSFLLILCKTNKTFML